MIKIKKIKNSSIEGDKRQYIPYILYWTCKDCQKEHKKDFTKDYFSYPPFSEWFEYTLYCYECEFEEEIRVLIDISFLVDISLEIQND